MREPAGLRRVGVATLIVGLVLGIIVPFAQFGGVFPAPWIVGVAVLPVLWGAVWVYLARRRTWWLWLAAQWLTLALACWLVLGPATDWAPEAVIAGLVFGTLLLVVWMVPVGIIAMLPARR